MGGEIKMNSPNTFQRKGRFFDFCGETMTSLKHVGTNRLKK